MLNVDKIKQDFPILAKLQAGKPLVYFDNAASTQKPKCVIDKLTEVYSEYYSNVHRGAYQIAIKASEEYENARVEIANFIGASTEEVIFTRGATEAINLVAYTWGKENIKTDDLIILSEYEHHSNLVPWQVLAKEKSAKLKFISADEDLLADFESDCKLGAKLACLTGMSNVLGCILPIKEMVKIAAKYGTKVLVDGAQLLPHQEVSVRELNCDFLVFSGHKMLAPSGIGVLYAKKEILENMPPFQYGGDMIREVSWFESSWNDLPWKFEAGTPNIADTIAFAEAVRYLKNIGLANIAAHEKELRTYAIEKMQELDEITIYQAPDYLEHGGTISFNLGDVHPHDLASILDDYAICIRAGHHCAKPLMEKLRVSSTARASFYLYNSCEEIDYFVKALKKAYTMFSYGQR